MVPGSDVRPRQRLFEDVVLRLRRPCEEGDVLAEIDTPDRDAQLAAAQAKLNSALAVVNVRKAELQFAD